MKFAKTMKTGLISDVKNTTLEWSPTIQLLSKAVSKWNNQKQIRHMIDSDKSHKLQVGLELFTPNPTDPCW